MTDDRYDDVGLDEHRELVDALPQRLLPLVAAGLMTPDEARACIRHARRTFALRLGEVDTTTPETPGRTGTHGPPETG